MKKSLRALWVLVLNISLGMLIFGAIIFFLEQGDYDPETKSFTRLETWQLNPAGDGYDPVHRKSPFVSIPASFWWALVTQTTVGYGDVVPRTVAGKITAGICMVWSLCVLALPVGVIGHNFQAVWLEYDAQKKNEFSVQENARKMAKMTIGNIDPISNSRMVKVEVYHRSGFCRQEVNDVFIGQGEVELGLDPVSLTSASSPIVVPLTENRAKFNRRVSGDVSITYKWTPSPTTEPDIMLQGKLVVTVVSAKQLATVDWKPGGVPDAYVVVSVYPNSPDIAGILTPKKLQTSVAFDETRPFWNESLFFDFLWHKEGVQAKRDLERKAIASTSFDILTMTNFVKDEKVNMDPATGQLLASIPRIQKEVSALQLLLPQLRHEAKSIREVMSSIIAELGLDLKASVTAEKFKRFEHHSGGGSEHLNHDCFAMPGVVPEEKIVERGRSLRRASTSAV
ncbi:unnamed protein product [Polarella glacialis]|uniref:C2 domain-containing protein n=1 Tax=Polarella glacialis TaxID=89957 RepID=A0A813GMQ2_POLGL|nr:unnamed protein product [Polarella glacialis]